MSIDISTKTNVPFIGAAKSLPERPHISAHHEVGQGAASLEKHGAQPGHAQKTVRGMATPAGAYLALVPTPDSPGFATISARAVQAWLALFAHAREHGVWMERPPADPGLAAVAHKDLCGFWTVGGLAYALGVGRNTAGAALQELTDYGWVRKSQGRHAGGQFGGFTYTLQSPTELTGQARSKIRKQLRKKGVEYRGFEGVAGRYLSETEIHRIKDEIEGDLADERDDGPDGQPVPALTTPQRLKAIESTER